MFNEYYTIIPMSETQNNKKDITEQVVAAAKEQNRLLREMLGLPERVDRIQRTNFPNE